MYDKLVYLIMAAQTAFGQATSPTLVPGSASYAKTGNSDIPENVYLTTTGYTLSEFTLAMTSATKVNGIVMTFTPDAGGATTSITLGSLTITGSVLYPVAVSKPVTSITTCKDNPTVGFRLHHADGTYVDNNFLSCS